MNRFYSSGELFVDLSQVSCVAFESVVVGGVLVKVSESVAFDLRKQVRAYKSSVDQKAERFRVGLSHNFFMMAWVADLIGNRIKRREAPKNVPVTEVLEGVGQSV